jgi:Lsr2
MATRTMITLEDDLDGSPAAETVRFGLGAAEYEIDLSAANAGRFRSQLAPFIGHARKTGRGQRSRPARTAATRQDSAEIRAWAKKHGIEVSDRGRIPASVTEQFEAATSRD